MLKKKTIYSLLTLTIIFLCILTFLPFFYLLDAQKESQDMKDWDKLSKNGVAVAVCKLDIFNPEVVVVYKPAGNQVVGEVAQLMRDDKNWFKFKTLNKPGHNGAFSFISTHSPSKIANSLGQLGCDTILDNENTKKGEYNFIYSTTSIEERDQIENYKNMKEKMEHYQNLSTEEKIKLCEKDQVYWQGLIDAYKRGDKTYDKYDLSVTGTKGAETNLESAKTQCDLLKSGALQ